jgi:nitrile hydratase
MTAALAAGARVRVRDDWPETRGACHIRTPHYLRGQAGTVLRHLGDFPNPEDLAFRRAAASVALYHVAFAIDDIWPEGRPGDAVIAEIYEHWLEAA